MIPRFLILAALSALFVSCAGGPYDFKEVPASRPHATLTTGRVVKNPFPFVVSDTSILEIDGKEPAFMRWDDKFRITPGPHKVGLQNYGQTHTGFAMMNFTAEEGKGYRVKSDAVGMKIKFWVEEADSGKAVGGAESDRVARIVVPSAPIFIPIPAG